MGEKKEVFCWKKSKRNEFDFALDLFKENASRWIKDLSWFCWALIIYKWICRGAIENLLMAKYLDGSSFYQESIGQTETFSMDRKSVKKLSMGFFSPSHQKEWYKS